MVALLFVPASSMYTCAPIELLLTLSPTFDVGATPAPIVVPTDNAFATPTPPAVTIAPLAVLVLSVVLLNVCTAVHVGIMPTSIGGAPSERMKVAAAPLTAVRPTLAVGFAPDWSPVFVPLMVVSSEM